MKIAFLSNKLTLRGTEVAMYDYADCNEKLLNNKSIIITRDINRHKYERDIHQEAYDKFKSRFSLFYYNNIDDIEKIIINENIDLLYIIKAGNRDHLITNKCKTLIHCVFNSKEKHGDIYTVISEQVNKISETNYPVLPHMIRVDESENNIREYLNIPKNAIVFGGMSGADEFNIPYIIETVKEISSNPIYSNIYFIFLNIIPFHNSQNVIFLPGTSNMKIKKEFINTCDAMLYGRNDGESFGLCCGEFSMCNKPVIARNKSKDYQPCDFHLSTLGDDAILHNNKEELFDILINWSKYNKDVSNNGYKKYTPEYVMEIFRKLIN